MILCRPDVHVERSLADIADNADDFADRIRREVVVPDFLADGVFAREILAGQRLVDEDNVWPGGIVGIGKQPSPNEQSLERGEIRWGHVSLIHLVVLAVKGFADESNPVGIAVAGYGRIADKADGLNTRQSGDAPDEFPVRRIKFAINGRKKVAEVEPRLLLADLIRRGVGLTGTHRGCDTTNCGACTVLVDGRRINSCLSLAAMHDGDNVTTIEGLADGDRLHPLQAAFVHHDGYQCGYCTPGQICSAAGMLNEFKAGWPSVVTEELAAHAELTDAEIRERMSGNICRCSAYPNIVAAIRDAAGETL